MMQCISSSKLAAITLICSLFCFRYISTIYLIQKSVESVGFTSKTLRDLSVTTLLSCIFHDSVHIVHWCVCANKQVGIVSE